MNKLNNNMRCFEIHQKTLYQSVQQRLNNNMRCFEMKDL